MAAGIELIGLTKRFGSKASAEHTAVDAADFAITLSALLDGMAVQIAVEDPDVPPSRAYDLAMRYASGQLDFTWQQHGSQIRR